jgi:hypothetical protein
MNDNGIVPLWCLLTTSSFSELLSHSRRLPAAISILKPADDGGSSQFLGLVQLLLTRAIREGGLKLTASGCLSRADVAALFEDMDWDIYERALIRSVNKILDETDVTPIHAARKIAQNAGLLRRRENRLHATKKAQKLDQRELFRTVFESMFWRTEMSELDEVKLKAWPQDHAGVVLWSISVSAERWIEPEALMKLGAMTRPVHDRFNRSALLSAFVLRILRPLVWLDMIEADRGDELLPTSLRQSPFRKTKLFDQSLHFEVGMHGLRPAQLH